MHAPIDVPPHVEVISAVRAQPFPDEWYDQSSHEHFWFRWRLAALMRMLRSLACAFNRETRVLEVGCGTGILCEQIERITHWIVDGTDINLPALARCGRRRGRSLYYDVTEECPTLLDTYEIVLIFDVIEHLEDPRPLLRSALRHMKEGGILVLNVPALPILFSRYDVAAGHFRRYSKESLASQLAGLDVTNLSICYWGFTLVPLLMARKLILSRLHPSAKVIQWGFSPRLPLVNSFLGMLMRAEMAVLGDPRLGTSLLCAGRRRSGPSVPLASHRDRRLWRRGSAAVWREEATPLSGCTGGAHRGPGHTSAVIQCRRASSVETPRARTTSLPPVRRRRGLLPLWRLLCLAGRCVLDDR